MSEDRTSRRPLLRRQAFCLGVLTATALLTLGDAAPVPAHAAGRVEIVKLPRDRIQPQAVTDSRGTIHLLYFQGEEGAGDLFYQRRAAGAGTWSKPLRVNSQPGSAVAIGTIRGGQIALGKAGRAHVVWFGSQQAKPKGPANPAMPADSPYNRTPLLYSRLNDAGTAFEPQRNLMQHTFALDGGPSVAADPQGHVYAVWHGLDGKKSSEGERRLWVARSNNEGKSFSREAPAWSKPTGACACCSAKVFADSQGAVYALYRSATAKVNRDIYLLTAANAGTTFQGNAVDRWKVDT
jgi:hypothetical protein